MNFQELLINSGPILGLLILFLIIFGESGLLIGFFFPGDTLLFGAGVLAAAGFFNLFAVCLVCFLATVAGDNIGYHIGERFGKKLFSRPDSIFFHKDHLIRAENFYEKHGKKTVTIARFIPIIRTFAPIVAGIGKMDYKSFVIYDLVGGLLWTVGLVNAGFFITKLFPNSHVEKYLEYVIIGVVVCSLAPAIYHLIKENLKKRSAAK